VGRGNPLKGEKLRAFLRRKIQPAKKSPGRIGRMNQTIRQIPPMRGRKIRKSQDFLPALPRNKSSQEVPSPLPNKTGNYLTIIKWYFLREG